MRLRRLSEERRSGRRSGGTHSRGGELGREILLTRFYISIDSIFCYNSEWVESLYRPRLQWT